MKLTLELYDTKYTVETDHDDYCADELKEIFSRMLVAATFPPSVIEDKDGGHYEYLEDNGIVIKKEEINGKE